MNSKDEREADEGPSVEARLAEWMKNREPDRAFYTCRACLGQVSVVSLIHSSPVCVPCLDTKLGPPYDLHGNSTARKAGR